MEAAAPTGSRPTPAAAPELTFAVEGAGVLEHAAVPTLSFAIRIEGTSGVPVRSAALNVQLRIAATRRRYDERARERLVEVFGLPEQWGRSLRSLHWCNVTLNVGPFTGSTLVDLSVTCSYDLDVTATRYFDALDDGEVPIELLFGGSVFYTGTGGALRVAPVSWDREAEWALPVAVWRQAIDRHFPDSGWLRLGRDSLDRLHAFKARRTLMSWDETVDALLLAAGETSDVAAVGRDGAAAEREEDR